MYFVFLMLAVVIISYIYKLGPIFLISLINILVNVFLLTRLFWFNIPWWLYIFVVGFILIIFGIRNESKEKDETLFLELEYIEPDNPDAPANSDRIRTVCWKCKRDGVKGDFAEDMTRI